MEVSSADKFESAFKEAVKARSGALYVTLSGVNNSNHKRIADLALKHRLPAISRFGDFVASGGLMSYGADAGRKLQARRLPHRQNPEGSQAHRSPG
jgi:putative tryptophan/tyrosine transport system substrate-binding protein